MCVFISISIYAYVCVHVYYIISGPYTKTNFSNDEHMAYAIHRFTFESRREEKT